VIKLWQCHVHNQGAARSRGALLVPYLLRYVERQGSQIPGNIKRMGMRLVPGYLHCVSMVVYCICVLCVVMYTHRYSITVVVVVDHICVWLAIYVLMVLMCVGYVVCI